MSDASVAFSESIGWTQANNTRTLRYAIIIDHGKVTYAATDNVPKSIENSGAEGVLAKL